MYKQIKPKPAQHIIPQFPHWDSKVLHAPGECGYCDRHAEWQALRQAWGIAFTGWEPEKKELPCPAWFARGDNCQVWSGNTPRLEVTGE